jgi:NTE family protein
MGRALVLGAGGITGISWEIGILKGLRDAGLDLNEADLVIGTSAGSVVGALIRSGVDLDELIESQRAAEGSAEIGADFDADRMLVTLVSLMQDGPTPQELRARIGSLAVAAPSASEAERLAVLESRLPFRDWPVDRLVVTGVDTETGEPVSWDRDSGVPLLLAVAASCAVPGVWPPVTIDGRRYMDGGVRSLTTVDLAAGHDAVVVVAPYTIGLSGSVDHELARLGPDVRSVVVSPDEVALEAIGPNPLDPARRLVAFEAGLRQAADVEPSVRAAWDG